MRVVIVVGLDLGWDNIVAVFEEGKHPKEDLEKTFPQEDRYIIFYKDLEEYDLDEYR